MVGCVRERHFASLFEATIPSMTSQAWLDGREEGSGWRRACIEGLPGLAMRRTSDWLASRLAPVAPVAAMTAAAGLAWATLWAAEALL